MSEFDNHHAGTLPVEGAEPEVETVPAEGAAPKKETTPIGGAAPAADVPKAKEKKPGLVLIKVLLIVIAVSVVVAATSTTIFLVKFMPVSDYYKMALKYEEEYYADDGATDEELVTGEDGDITLEGDDSATDEETPADDGLAAE